jgi:hypothetical protein
MDLATIRLGPLQKSRYHSPKHAAFVKTDRKRVFVRVTYQAAERFVFGLNIAVDMSDLRTGKGRIFAALYLAALHLRSHVATILINTTRHVFNTAAVMGDKESTQYKSARSSWGQWRVS